MPRGAPLRTIYLGGGTPTALSDAQLALLLGRVHERIGDARPANPPAPAAAPRGPVQEWTCEANPESVTREKARLLREAGVDRVSLGAQSFDPEVLAALGRDHAPAHVFRALDVLRDAGFRRLSLDLMFAAPGETSAQLERDLATLSGLGLEHVSAYCLAYEPGTPLTRLRAEGRVTPATDDVELVQFRIVRERLASAGLDHYEISNFARPGAESLHNLVYWRGEEYFGVGLGAGSYEHGTRRTNTRTLADYLGEWGGDAATGEPARFPPHEAETLDPRSRAREMVILGLRLRRGIEECALEAGSGFDLAQLYPDGEIDALVERGLLEPAEGCVRLTDRGLELADEVFVALV